MIRSVRRSHQEFPFDSWGAAATLLTSEAIVETVATACRSGAWHRLWRVKVKALKTAPNTNDASIALSTFSPPAAASVPAIGTNLCRPSSAALSKKCKEPSQVGQEHTCARYAQHLLNKFEAV